MPCEFSVLEWREFRQSEASTGRSSTARCRACAWRAVFTVKGMNSGKGIDPCPRSPPWGRRPWAPRVGFRAWTKASEALLRRVRLAHWVFTQTAAHVAGPLGAHSCVTHGCCGAGRPHWPRSWTPTPAWQDGNTGTSVVAATRAGTLHTIFPFNRFLLLLLLSTSFTSLCFVCCHFSRVLRWKVSHFTWVSFLS